MKKNNKKGFTLAELLIVVAIIAVLVAVAIPVFTSQLEKSKVATDEANVRGWYAEQVANMLANDTAPATTYDGPELKADGAEVECAYTAGTTTGDASYTVTYSATYGSTSVTFGE